MSQDQTLTSELNDMVVQLSKLQDRLASSDERSQAQSLYLLRGCVHGLGRLAKGLEEHTQAQDNYITELQERLQLAEDAYEQLQAAWPRPKLMPSSGSDTY